MANGYDLFRRPPIGSDPLAVLEYVRQTAPERQELKLKQLVQPVHTLGPQAQLAAFPTVAPPQFSGGGTPQATGFSGQATGLAGIFFLVIFAGMLSRRR